MAETPEPKKTEEKKKAPGGSYKWYEKLEQAIALREAADKMKYSVPEDYNDGAAFPFISQKLMDESNMLLDDIALQDEKLERETLDAADISDIEKYGMPPGDPIIE